MASLSVVIITYNEEKNIHRCIESVRGVADEVVVLDSFSGDGTVAKARELGATCYWRAFTGYGEQRNVAAGLSTHGHLLFLDADEYLSPELRASLLREKVLGFPYDGYCMNRLSRYCGRWIRHSSWYPDRKLRLLRRGSGQWTDDLVHESLQPEAGATIGFLAGDLLHIPYADQADHLAKIHHYSTLAALRMQSRGRKPSLLRMIFSPVCSFFSGLILHAGFLDGYAGLLIARRSAYYTFLKYAKLWKLATRADRYPALPSSGGYPQKRASADATA